MTNLHQGSAAERFGMRKYSFILAGILLLGVGVGIGWFAAQRTYGLTGSGTSGKPALWFRPSDPEIILPPPLLDTWKYPGSKVDNSNTGGGYSLGGLQFGATERIALVTADDFDKVWSWYKVKCRLQDLGVASATHRFEGGGDQYSMTFKLFDDIEGNSFAGPKSESLSARAFTVQSLRYTLVGFVYRQQGANATCILLAYRPNLEFIGLLKERLVKE